MKVLPLAHFVCPLDGAPLVPHDGGVRCDSGHRFDRAREGYLNLLPVQHKASRDPGDDKAMVAARRRVVDAGLFAPLAEAVFDAVRDYARRWPGEQPLRVVDAGCGEGYTLTHLHTRAAQSDDALSLELAGYDISKWAVRAAARRSPKLAWAVASNRQPPVPAASIDVILSLFGFAHWLSFAAILNPRGRVLTVDADTDHLLELRQVIYPQVEQSEAQATSDAEARGWRVCAERRLAYGVQLNTAAKIHDLIAMTPHAHRMPASGRAALAALNSIAVSMSMVMREWQPPARV